MLEYLLDLASEMFRDPKHHIQTRLLLIVFKLCNIGRAYPNVLGKLRI